MRDPAHRARPRLGWLATQGYRLDRWAEPRVDRPSQHLPALRLYDGALLVACPARRRNLAETEFDRHLVRRGAEGHLSFEAAEIQTGVALRYVAPAELALFVPR